MKHLLFLFPASLFGAGTLAEVAPGLADYGPWAQFGAVGLLGFLVYWLVVKQGPKERTDAQAHTETVVKAATDQFAETQRHQHEDMLAITTQIAALTKAIIQNAAKE
ncbi:MAG TPA: hypothetical protein VMY42_06515 [Thermoguttaceae bacterium]|nr:hypothetical protein [Thermoguttaceae bacterium]